MPNSWSEEGTWRPKVPKRRKKKEIIIIIIIIIKKKNDQDLVRIEDMQQEDSTSRP